MLTFEESREVGESGACRENPEVARDRLRRILHTKKDGVQLKALLQTLQAFKMLHKETKSKNNNYSNWMSGFGPLGAVIHISLIAEEFEGRFHSLVNFKSF